MDNKEAAITPADAQPDASESAASGGSLVRRRLFAAGFAGAATSLLPWLNSKASATTPTDGTTPDTRTVDSDGNPFNVDTTNASDITTGGTQNSTELTNPSGDTSITQAPTGAATPGSSDGAAPTTTLPPVKRPTAADIALLDFAQSIELAIRDLYDVAIDAKVFDESIARDMSAIREAHEGYATSIAGMIGRNAANKRNATLFDALSGDFAGKADAVAAAAAQLEDTAVATHISLIGELVGVDGSALIASIVVIESRNATLLRAISGVEDLAGRLAFDAQPLTPADYPLA
ncbi:MAG: ferritin-like domain-containing protein [Ilumatobacteraceae bacterium]